MSRDVIEPEVTLPFRAPPQAHVASDFGTVLQVGTTCWRLTHATRGQFLIDGKAYYRDLHHSLRRARQRIFICGWDIASDIQLTTPEHADGYELYLLPLLRQLMATNTELEVFILVWDSFPFFFNCRESRRHLRERFSHPRIHLVFQNRLPMFASFHQKVVTIDGRVAYCGGIDLTANRRDSPSHRPRRINDVYHGSFIPLHDVQLKVEGEAVVDLEELLRDDWWQACGEWIPSMESRSKSSSSPASPPSLQVGEMADVPQALYFSSAPLAISTTRAAFRGCPERREIETLLPRLIRSARHSIYIETQYLTAEVVVESLVASLQGKNGPEIVIVTSREHQGILERRTLGALRNRQVERLRTADRFDRLGLYFPRLSGFPAGVSVHSKLLFVDNHFLSIGSANLTNRSLGLDSECLLTLDASSDEGLRRALEMLRTRLLSEHLHVAPTWIAERFEAGLSMRDVIRERSGFSRSLQALPNEKEDVWSRWLVTRKWSDPSTGLRPQMLFYRMLRRWLGRQVRCQADTQPHATLDTTK